MLVPGERPVLIQYHAVLFDLDGTLVDSGRDIIASVRYALDRVFSDHDQPDDADILVLIGRPLESIVRELGYPADKESTRRFAEAYRGHYAEHYNDSTRLYPGVKELIEQLRAAGVRLGLVTTKHQIQAEFTLAGIGLSCYFEYVHGWEEGRKHKPDPEPILTALGRLDIPPGLALMVGDSELDVEAAKAARVDTCAVTYGFRPAWFLKSLNPDFLVAHPADILSIVFSLDVG